jgi:hypothetical protein
MTAVALLVGCLVGLALIGAGVAIVLVGGHVSAFDDRMAH